MRFLNKRRVLVLGMIVGTLLVVTAVYRPSISYDPQSQPELERLAGAPGEVAEQSLTDVQAASAQSIRLVAGTSLLFSILDDDPTCTAVVDVAVVTADGAATDRRIQMWEYGLVAPWGFYPQGDGWKLMGAERG